MAEIDAQFVEEALRAQAAAGRDPQSASSSITPMPTRSGLVRRVQYPGYSADEDEDDDDDNNNNGTTTQQSQPRTKQQREWWSTWSSTHVFAVVVVVALLFVSRKPVD